jgi:gliding motility-associated-like protein
LYSTSPNGIAGTWTPPQINPNQDGTYVFHPNVTVCAFDQTLQIAVIPPIDYTLAGGCSNGRYFLNAISNEEAFNLNNLTFHWYDFNGNDIGTNQPSVDVTTVVEAAEDPLVFPLTFGLIIEDEHGCSTSKNFTIDKIFCKIPKGISPNGDSDNEFFDLRGFDIKRLEIFNRYGVKVYSKDNYTVEWKGQTDSGKELPDATYYYYIEFETGQPKTGWVYLIR